MTAGLGPVPLIARRELLARVRGRSFLVSTAAIALLVIGYLLVQGYADAGQPGVTRVGMAGQATGVAAALSQETAQLGLPIEVVTVTDPAQGAAEVRSGALDALVSGAPDTLHVTVADRLDDRLRTALTDMVRQQAMLAQLAEAGLRPADVYAQVDAAHVTVSQLAPTDGHHGQRVGIGVVLAVLLSAALVLFVESLARGLIQEHATQVLDVLLAAVRPAQLLAGKVAGLVVAGLAQLLVVGLVGLAVATVTGVLAVPGVALSALALCLLWYLLGSLVCAGLLAATTAAVSDRFTLRSTLLPAIGTVLVGFVVGVVLLAVHPASVATAVLSVLPPFAPVLMPARAALGAVPGWQLLLAVLLALAACAGLARLGDRLVER